MWANPRPHKLTRLMRLFAFSFVAAILLVSLLIVFISFVWDEFVAARLDRPPYEARIEFVVPSIILVALIISKLLWDAAEGRTGGSRKRSAR